jgi:hypothetical protein
MEVLEWALNPVYWCEQELGIKPRLFQRDLLNTTARRICLCCHRQSGKTMGAAMLAAHHLIFYTGHVVVASPTYRQSDRMARSIKKFYYKCTHKPVLTTDNRFFLETEIGSSLSIISLDQPENIRGLSGVRLAIVDEASAVDVEAYSALVPSMAAVEDSQQIIISTPRGRIGLFWEIWNNDSYEKYFLPVSKNPEISQSWLEGERKTMGDLLFSQEYECSFTSAISSVFDLDLFYRAVDPSINTVVL